MAIRTIITRGYGNGTFNGTIGEVVTRGYTIGAAVAAVEIKTPISITLVNDGKYTLTLANDGKYTLEL